MKAVDKVSNDCQALKHPRTSRPKSRPIFIFVKDGTKLVKIRWNDILYVEGLKDYVTIHTRTQKVISLQRLKVLEEQLPADKFIRVHNSFIVALDAIDSVHKDKIQIGQAQVPIGDTYKKSFREFIEGRQIQ
ncbi:MAG: LytTR family DNA-binding domain-containing protein [Bacteroidota bacterium]